ncbi:hypothetical protein D3C80_2141240 [compost metagenome]
MDSRIFEFRGDDKCLGIDVITGIHGDLITPFGLDGKLSPAKLGIVDDIIVHK